MVHFLVLGFIVRAAHALPALSGSLRPILPLIAVAAMIAAAAVLHYAVERPARAWLRRVIDRRSAAVAVPVLVRS